MSRMQLVRTAPRQLGVHRPASWRRRFRGLGQDDEGDFSDVSVMADESPVLPSGTFSIPVAPTIDTGSVIDPSLLGGGDYLPATPGTTVLPMIGSEAQVTSDLPALILSGQLPPPSGSGLSTAQVQQIAAAGGSESDIQSILAGKTTPNAVLASLQAASTGLSAAAKLTSLPTPGRATPVTVPLSSAGSVIGTTSIASPLSTLTAATIIPGIPNWAVGLGLILGVSALASAFAGGKRR